MPILTLSEQMLDILVCPDGREHMEYFDKPMRGLYVDVSRSGRLTYRVRYRFNKRHHVLTLGDARVLHLDEARSKAREIRRKLLQGGDPKEVAIAEDGPTVTEFFSHRYLPYVQSYKRSWGTDEVMIRHHIVPALGARRMGSLLAPDLAGLIQCMRDNGYAAGTCNRALVLLRYGFNLALRWKIPGIRHNPAKELRNLKESNRIECFLSEGQLQHLHAAARDVGNATLAPIVAFLIYTGARKREVLDARWQDIDWHSRVWCIPKTKSDKVRRVPLSSGAIKLLEDLKRRGREGRLHEHVFANPDTGLPFVSIFYSWDTARKRAGLPTLRIHDLRHSFASFLVNGGHSLYEVQELLGHADCKTTARYAHLSRERLFEAVEVVPAVE